MNSKSSYRYWLRGDIELSRWVIWKVWKSSAQTSFYHHYYRLGKSSKIYEVFLWLLLENLSLSLRGKHADTLDVLGLEKIILHRDKCNCQISHEDLLNKELSPSMFAFRDKIWKEMNVAARYNLQLDHRHNRCMRLV